MGQIEELIEEIDKMCERIWAQKEVSMQEIGMFVQSMYPSFMELLPIVTQGNRSGEEGDLFMSGINHIMEGLQVKDQLLLADAFYYEIRGVLKLAAESGV